MNQQDDHDLGGWMYALAAFAWWGIGLPMLLITLHAQAERFASPQYDWKFHWNMEILSHRAVWVLVICLLLVAIRNRWSQVGAVLRSRKAVLLLVVSMLLIAVNWFGFIIGVSLDKLSEVSLGYYINPLLNVLLGCWILGEKLRRFQIVAVVIASLGVGWLIFIYGETPWIAFLLAVSFAFYAMIRKQMKFDSMVCLTFEVAYCLPLALGYFVYRFWQGPELITMQWDPTINWLLFACGPATALPLIWFGVAAQRLRLSTIGFIQFLTPTCQLVVALTVNGESLPMEKLIGYVLIWIAIGFYLWDALKKKGSS